MKQTNHAPESLGKEKTDCDGHLLCDCDSCTAVWASRNKRVKNAEFAQQQTDKLYTREELKDATDKAMTAFLVYFDPNIERLAEFHEQWFNQNYPK